MLLHMVTHPDDSARLISSSPHDLGDLAGAMKRCLQTSCSAMMIPM
jgi:hypothetical protein